MQLSVGGQIKGYTLERILGQGASGEVWKATDGTRSVAIKFMNENLMKSKNADKHRTRLEREINALKQLTHAHIPQLFDYDLDFARPYIAMEYISDEPYDRLITRGQMLPVPIALRLRNLRDLADALRSAHELDIIHRDVKPGNIAGINKAYLLDFSVALKQEDVMNTVMEVGTALYTGPEDMPDQLNDNYAFGLVSYEVLFGTHAIFKRDDKFRTQYHARIVAGERLKSGEWRMPSKIVANEMPLDLREANLPALDAAFSKILGNRNTRYTDAREFVRDLMAAVPHDGSIPVYSPAPVNVGGVPTEISSPTPLEADGPATFIPPEPITEENFTQLEVQRQAEETGVDAPKPAVVDAPQPAIKLHTPTETRPKDNGKFAEAQQKVAATNWEENLGGKPGSKLPGWVIPAVVLVVLAILALIAFLAMSGGA